MDLPPRSSRRSRGRPSALRFPVALPVLLILLIAGFAAIAAAGVYLVTLQTVTLLRDGVSQEIQTHQSTVAGLIAELEGTLYPQDIVSPSAETPIRNGMVIRFQKAHMILVEDGSQQQQIVTQATEPREILAQARITVGQNDVIEVDNGPLLASPYNTAPGHIQVLRSASIQIEDNGVPKTIQTVRRTVGDVLHDAGLALYIADVIEPNPAAPIGQDKRISILRSVPITLRADGRTLATRTHGKTVGAALAEIGIALVGLDYVTPDESAAVTSGITIHVVRVTEEEEIEQSPLPFKQTTQPDPTLPIDTRQVIQQGIAGVQEQRIRTRREDGLEVSRSAPERVILVAPRDEITAVGTLPVLKTLDTPFGKIQYWRALKMRAASYKLSSTGKTPDDPQYGITATGKPLHKGIVAVDPKIIPLGTALYIPGYGMAVAEDTGGAVQGLVIDLGYDDADYQEWSGSVDVYLLAPIPPADQIPALPEGTVQGTSK